MPEVTRAPLTPLANGGRTTVAATIGTAIGAGLVPVIGPGALPAGIAITALLGALGTWARDKAAKPDASKWWQLLDWLG